MPSKSPSIISFTGIFLIGMASLTLELVLTRIFSVVMSHHFAFLAISVALFGLGASGVFLHVFSSRFSADSIYQHLSWTSLFFGLSVIISFFISMSITLTTELIAMKLLLVSLRFLLMAIPFFFGGLCLALLLKYFPTHAGKIYCADLVGAGMGCLITAPLLSLFGGVSSLIIVCIICTSASALFFLQDKASTKGVYIPLIAGSILIALFVMNVRYNLVPITSSSRLDKTKVVYEAWNSFSRIAVYELDDRSLLATVSNKFQGDIPKFKFIEIDSTASSYLLNYSRKSPRNLDHLKYDVTFIAYELRPHYEKVFVIGPGGGRDIVAAVEYGADKIYGLEVNPIMIDLVEDVYGDFSGHLYSLPNVQIEVDDARSYLNRNKEQFDMIQAALACTWAADASGAFVLTENSLYTKEAFASYLDHLTHEGILSMTVWFRGFPRELLRLVSLGTASLKDSGVTDPWEHIVVVLNRKGIYQDSAIPHGYGTFLLKKTPFTASEIERLKALCKEMGFDIAYAHQSGSHYEFSKLAYASDPEAYSKSFSLDISPTVDDKPFFFYLLRFQDFWKALTGDKALEEALRGDTFHFKVVSILIGLFITTLVLSLLFILGPLFLIKKNGGNITQRRLPYLLFFACIGLGYMLIEIPLLQRFILFLGKPIYSISVILFSLLVFSGAGSYFTNRLNIKHCKKTLAWLIFLLVSVLILYVFFLPGLLSALLKLSTFYRIAISVLLLAPLGFLMGMPFPVGIRLADQSKNDLIPWLWGINGVTSVLASVLAVVISMNFGFTVTMLVGQLAYISALGSVRFFG